MKRYSKRVREEAALICSIAASSGAALTFPYYNMIASDLGLDLGDWFKLAVDAWHEAMRPRGNWTRAVDAEAEALIRTGWSSPNG